MTEPNSKREVASDLKALWLLVVAAWFTLTPNAAVSGAAFDGGQAESQAPMVAATSGERRPTAIDSSVSIRANLATVAASAFEPALEGSVDLATFATKTGSVMLNVPAPGSMSPAAPATDHIPEPGAIGFGLAVAALIFGNVAKALMRCWKITSAAPGREGR